MVLLRHERIQRSILQALRQKVEINRDKMERSLLLKVFLQWKEFVKNNQLLKSYLIEEERLAGSSLELPHRTTQKERFLNLLMPQLGKYSEAGESRSRFFEMSDRGLDDTEDNSNSFADYKSMI